MTIGVGGGRIETELDRLSQIRVAAEPLPRQEYKVRIRKATALMEANQISVIYLSAGSNLYYFTGTQWHASERMVGALLSLDGSIEYIVPTFERGTFSQHMFINGNINCWHEHESPFELFFSILKSHGLLHATIGIDEATPFQHFGELSLLGADYRFIDARPVTAGCRSRKSSAEILLMQTAMNMTLEVHKSAARILEAGISTTAVASFINDAHKAIGSPGGSTFCAVQFGKATAFPHGVPYQQQLSDGDVVLIDTGCLMQNYHSDITRTYVFGEPQEQHRTVWDDEKNAQATAFAAAKLGARCGDVDIAARSYLESRGYGPDYGLPGLPHRTGHGIGLDVHEWPYLVRSDDTKLDVGMCFSNEPMLCINEEFGIRLEDHFYMTEDGSKWFTSPSHSIDDPFGLQVP